MDWLLSPPRPYVCVCVCRLMECAAIWRERRALKMLLQVHRGRRRRVFFCPVEAAADAPRQRHVGALRVLLPIQQHNRHIQKRACGPRKALQEGFRGNAPPAPPRDGRGASSSRLQGAARSKRERTTAVFAPTAARLSCTMAIHLLRQELRTRLLPHTDPLCDETGAARLSSSGRD